MIVGAPALLRSTIIRSWYLRDLHQIVAVADAFYHSGDQIALFIAVEQFVQETLRVLGVALEQVCIALRTGDCDDDVKQAIANKVIELAKTGERNPDLLCERALKDIRQSQGVKCAKPSSTAKQCW